MVFPVKLAVCATAAILAAPALAVAQAQPAAPVSTAAAPPAAPPMAAPSAATTGIDASAVTMPATQFPPPQAQALASGDNALVTNGPVPDTPANRAKYGSPLSNAGKVSPPEGN